MNDATDNLDRDMISPSQYADDIGIWSSGSSVQESMRIMQDGVNALNKWCKKWFVALNLLKSQLVIFTKCVRPKKEIDECRPMLRMFGEDVPVVSEATYLGVIFDTRLTWELQFRKMTTRAYQRLNLLRHL